jgi:hypothetical protein
LSSQAAEHRWKHERGAVGRHVVSVVKRYRVWTDDETKAIGAALAERSRRDQGLPPTIEVEAALDRIAAILAERAKP